MPTEKEIEAAAKMLCFRNGQHECVINKCTPENCEIGMRDYKEDAVEVLKAAERARGVAE